MSTTILQEIARRIEAAGWTVESITEPSWLSVWHSNQDDQAHLQCANEVWEGFWEDRDGKLMKGFAFHWDIPATSTNVEEIAGAIIRRLAQDDPTCPVCGTQGGGHTQLDCEAAR